MTIRSRCVIPSRWAVAAAFGALLTGALLVGVAFAADPIPVASPPRPTTLDELGRLLDAQPGRLASLDAEARLDPRYRVVRRYLSLSPEDLRSAKRSPNAKDLLAIVFATDAEYGLRHAAFLALTAREARTHDRDLADERQRNRFSLLQVVEHLENEKDMHCRVFAHDWLQVMHGESEPAARAYDAREIGRPTWKPATSAWKRTLRR